MIDVRKQQEQSSSMTERRSRVTIAEAVPLLTRIPLHLRRVCRAGMGMETGPVCSPEEIKSLSPSRETGVVQLQLETGLGMGSLKCRTEAHLRYRAGEGIGYKYTCSGT